MSLENMLSGPRRVHDLSRIFLGNSRGIMVLFICLALHFFVDDERTVFEGEMEETRIKMYSKARALSS